MKKVLVTGATGGIGEAIARSFSKEGYFVYLHYHSNKAKAEQLLKELKNAEILGFDISDKTAVDEQLQDLEVDVLVNNAGITKDALFFFMEDTDWSSVIDTSVNGTYYVTKNIMRNMIKNKKGSVVNVASVSGLVGNAGQTNYSAAKGAMIAFSKSLSVEVARYGIRVNAVAPGLIASEMTEGLDLKTMKKTIPLQRIGKPQEVAECVLFLADKASFVTGEVLNISGGMVR
jgi:3-oxoacyl-[acyl-carrier protein] reductase